MAKSSKTTDSAIRTSHKSQVFDITRPGKSGVAVSSSSKPIIITNRPVIKDTVVNETVSDALSAPPVPKARKLVIKPLSEQEPVLVTGQESQDQPEVKTPEVPDDQMIVVKTGAAVAPEEPVDSDADDEPLPEPQAAPVLSAEPKPAPVPITEITNAKGEPVTSLNPELPVGVPAVHRDDKQLTPQQNDEALRFAQERAARLEHMIEKEQYFLPINAVEERHNRRVAVLGVLLVILLAVAWYDTALDAGLVTNTYNLPHTSFFTVR